MKTRGMENGMGRQEEKRDVIKANVHISGKG